MGRIALKNGTIVTGDQTYIIDSVAGDGANCIVYFAHYLDNAGYTHDVLLKECYPAASNISRTENDLIWIDSAEQNRDIAAFQDAYKKLMQAQNAEKNRNSTVVAFQIFNANGTMYSVVHKNIGVTYDKETGKSLLENLETALALTKAVKNHHDNGYLHLDIKPSNFLVIPETRQLVKLFDLDTVMPKSEIATAQCIPYSEDWAAPEQLQGQRNKICEATDLYAIGAILFEKVMGRKVEQQDCGLFADWSFEVPCFDGINPKVKRLLRNIFRKTLAVSVGRRYLSAAEMIVDLEKAVDILNAGQPFLVSDCPNNTSNMVGRGTDIGSIRQAFFSGVKAVFLHGDAGIGKSTLAIAYGNACLKEYDAVLFVRYEDSLETVIENLSDSLQNCDGGDMDRKKILRRVLDQNTLVIVDNFDVEIGQDPYFEEFLRYRAHFIFTTRTDFSDAYSGDIVQLDVSELPYIELVRVFENASGIVASEQNELLEKLFAKVAHNTYVVELLGRQAAASGWSIERLYSKVKTGLDNLADSEKVRTNKDGRIAKLTIPESIRVTWRIANLSESRKQVLRNLYMLRFLLVDKNSYRRFTHADSRAIDSLNDLVELSWVKVDYPYYYLHPLVQELVKNDLQPDRSNCIDLYQHFLRRIQSSIPISLNDEAEEYEFESNCKLLCAFFRSLDVQAKESREMVISWCFQLIDNDIFVFYPYESHFKLLLGWLYEADIMANLPTDEAFYIEYLIFVFWLSSFNWVYVGDDELKTKQQEMKAEMLYKAFNRAKNTASSLNGVLQDEALDKLYSVISDYLLMHSFNKGPEEFIAQAYSERPQCFDLSYISKESFGIPLTEAEQKEKDLREKEWEDHMRERCAESYMIAEGDVIRRVRFELSAFGKELSDDATYNDIDSALDEAYSEEILSAADKLRVVQTIANNQELSIFEKAQRIYFCTTALLEKFHYGIRLPHWKFSLNWSDIEEILDIEIDFLIDPSALPDDPDAQTDWEWHLHKNIANHVITYAALDNIEKFDEYVVMLQGIIESNIQSFADEHWHEFVDWSGAKQLPLQIVCGGLKILDKQSLLVPYLVAAAEKWEQYAQDHDCFDERDFFSLYKAIADVAEDASCEENLPQEKQKEFATIWSYYQYKIDCIANVDFFLKETEE